MGDGLGRRPRSDAGGAGRHISWGRILLPFWFKRRGVRRVRNIQYVDDGTFRHRLDIYHRGDVDANAPVLLQIHGGAWVIGRKDQQGLPLMYHVAARGWVCVAINYRLSPARPGPTSCSTASARWRGSAPTSPSTAATPTSSSSRADRPAATSPRSMGLTANDPEFQPGFEDVDTSVQAMIPFYGVFDWSGEVLHNDALRELLERRIVKRTMASAPDVYRKASPIFHVRPDAPPTLVVHGDLDTLAPVDPGARVRRPAARDEPVAGRLRRAPRRPPRVRGVQLGPHDARDRGRRPLPRVARQRCARRAIAIRRFPQP